MVSVVHNAISVSDGFFVDDIIHKGFGSIGTMEHLLSNVEFLTGMFVEFWY
jgi:hypothetical protein